MQKIENKPCDSPPFCYLLYMKDATAKDERISKIVTCWTCNGKKTIQLNDGRQLLKQVCPCCNGEGKITILAWK